MKVFHRCDERCLCPGCGKTLYYAPGPDQHACSDPACAHAHGLYIEWQGTKIPV